MLGNINGTSSWAACFQKRHTYYAVQLLHTVAGSQDSEEKSRSHVQKLNFKSLPTLEGKVCLYLEKESSVERFYIFFITSVCFKESETTFSEVGSCPVFVGGCTSENVLRIDLSVWKSKTPKIYLKHKYWFFSSKC